MIQYNRQLVYQVKALKYDSVSKFTVLYLSSIIYHNTHKVNACINICKYNTHEFHVLIIDNNYNGLKAFRP